MRMASKLKKIYFFSKKKNLKMYSFSDWVQTAWGLSMPYSLGSSSKEFSPIA
jgi:hypothetical protein